MCQRLCVRQLDALPCKMMLHLPLLVVLFSIILLNWTKWLIGLSEWEFEACWGRNELFWRFLSLWWNSSSFQMLWYDGSKWPNSFYCGRGRQSRNNLPCSSQTINEWYRSQRLALPLNLPWTTLMISNTKTNCPCYWPFIPPQSKFLPFSSILCYISTSSTRLFSHG